MDAVITLISTTKEKNDYGVLVETPVSRNVFCQRKSISRAEFFGAGRNGLNPDFMVEVFSGDYAGERTCVFEGQPYAIYRTYLPEGSDYVELYCQRKGGTNGVMATMSGGI